MSDEIAYYSLYNACKNKHQQLSKERYIPFESIYRVYNCVLTNCYISMGTSSILGPVVSENIDIPGITTVIKQCIVSRILHGCIKEINEILGLPILINDNLTKEEVSYICNNTIEHYKQLLSNFFNRSKDGHISYAKIESNVLKYFLSVSVGAQIYSIAVQYVSSMPLISFADFFQHIAYNASYYKDFIETTMSKISSSEGNSRKEIENRLLSSLKNRQLFNEEIINNKLQIINWLNKPTLLQSVKTTVYNQDLSSFAIKVIYQEEFDINKVLSKHINDLADFISNYRLFCGLNFRQQFTKNDILRKYLNYLLKIEAFPNYEIPITASFNLSLNAYVRVIPQIVEWNNRNEILTIHPYYEILFLASMMLVEERGLSGLDSKLIAKKAINNFIDVFSHPLSIDLALLQNKIYNKFPKITSIKQSMPSCIQNVVNLCDSDNELLVNIVFLKYCINASSSSFNFEDELLSIIQPYYDAYIRFMP